MIKLNVTLIIIYIYIYIYIDILYVRIYPIKIDILNIQKT